MASDTAGIPSRLRIRIHGRGWYSVGVKALTWFCGLSLIAALVWPVSARAEDAWLGRDKALHFGFSTALAAGGYAGSTFLVNEPWQRAAAGAGFGMALGIGKEVYDATGHGDPSWRDLTWDLIGCTLGAGVSMLIDYALRSSRDDRPQTYAAGVLLRWQ